MTDRVAFTLLARASILVFTAAFLASTFVLAMVFYLTGAPPRAFALTLILSTSVASAAMCGVLVVGRWVAR